MKRPVHFKVPSAIDTDLTLRYGIGIDRCSFSPMIIVGGMFHATLKLYYEPLADLRAWKIFGHGESVASLTLLDGFIACYTPPDSRSMLFICYIMLYEVPAKEM